MFAILLTEGMDPFYEIITSYPTVFFTFFLFLSIAFLIIAAFGLLDFEILDIDLPDASDLSEGNATNYNVLAGLLMRFGLEGVPVSIIISLVSVFGWILSYYGVLLLSPLVPEGVLSFVVNTGILLGSLYLGTWITAFAIRPLRKFFKNANAQTARTIVGKTAVVRTSRVDANFGEAKLDDSGAELILKVRPLDPDTTFKKGDRVVLLELQEPEGFYKVIPESEFK